MLTPRQFSVFTPWRQQELLSSYTFIPCNDYGIKSGYYRAQDVLALLRKHHHKSKAVLFIAEAIGREDRGDAAGGQSNQG